MKKIGFLLFIFIISILVVNAEDNQITITEKGNELYYQSEISSSDFFFTENAMIPGEAYQKDLVINNTTSDDYSLFLKINPKDETSELLDYLDLKIENKEVIYEGKMCGFISNDTSELQGTIPLGEFNSKTKKTLKFYVKLNSDYNNTLGAETEVDWTFYAKKGDEVKEIVENPKTWSQGNNYYSAIILLIIIIGLVVLYKKIRSTI